MRLATPQRRRLLAAGLLGGAAAWVQGATAAPAASDDAAAAPSPWAELPRLQGQATLRFLGLPVYDAWLWVGPQFDPQRYAQAPLGLALRYRRAISGRDLVQRSLLEMARCGARPDTTVQAWRGFMSQAFPDVAAGERLHGLWQPAQALTRLEAPATATRAARSSALADADFGVCFFGIWLAAHSSEPALRLRLLGLAA